MFLISLKKKKNTSINTEGKKLFLNLNIVSEILKYFYLF